jgi:hypothetical protein
MAGRDHSGVRDQQRPLHPDPGRQFPNPVHRIQPEHQPGAGLMVERRKGRGGVAAVIRCCWRVAHLAISIARRL